MALKKIRSVIDDVASSAHQRAPTLWELAEEYPRLVVRVIPNPDEPFKSMAVLNVPLGGDKRLLRSIKGGH